MLDTPGNICYLRSRWSKEPARAAPDDKEAMFKTEIDNAIVGVVNSILENVEIPLDCALYVSARVRVKKPESRSRGKGGFLHFVFQRAWGGRYTRVWFQAGGEKGFTPDDTLWENTCNHDSEWRSDGVRDPITKTYFEYCEKVAPDLPPCELEATADIHCMAIVDVETQREPDGYHRKLVKVVR